MEAFFSKQRGGLWRSVALCFWLLLLLCACNPSGAVSHPHASSCTALPSRSAARATEPLATIPLPSHPFKSIATSDGQWIFVSVDAEDAASNGIAVLHREAAQICLLRVIPLPEVPFGVALTPDQSLLLVADYSTVAVVDVARAETGRQGAVLGSVQEKSDSLAIEVEISLDGRYAFVANENDGTLGVINLQRVRAHDFSSATLVALIPVNQGPLGEDSGLVGIAISPDDRYLYVTSRIDTGDPSPQGNVCFGYPPGTLSVVDVARAEQGAAHALLTHVFAGCGPVRVILSPSSDTAWVTVQENNLLLAFSTRRLLTHPTSALLASLSIGQAPTGIALVKNGSVLVVANSNRFLAPQTPQTLTLLDAKQAIVGKIAILGTVKTGAFPRELTLETGGQTLLLTNYNSDTLTIIDVADLPGPLQSSQDYRVIA